MTHITIHRGTRQIGGCVTEISTEKAKVFIDFGENLPGNNTELSPIDGLTTGNSENSALFLTHYHGDHMGALNKVMADVPVFMGKTAKAIHMNYAKRVKSQDLPLFEKIRTFKPLEAVAIGDIIVTPLMVDHSAFDSYMFIVEAGGKRILHTGDFRLHGIRGAGTLKAFDFYVKYCDYIICEGTTLSRDSELPMTEIELIRKAAALMKQSKYVFVLCSTTNIDRIGAFYHANPKGRLFICDSYQKKQLETVQKATTSGFYNFENVYSYAANLDKFMEEKGFCMLVRQGKAFERVMERYRGNCLVIYSMWTGYLDERAKNQGLVDFLSAYRYRVLHTSGHASPEDIRRLYEIVQPTCGLILIHTDSPEMFGELIPDGKIIMLDDGEQFVV